MLQIQSKQRVRDHGEVFTSEREVNAMLDLLKQETDRIESRFLDPACGTGNFLIEVLKRKLGAVKNRYKKSKLEYERYAVMTVSSLYGVDIQEDNVIHCRKRLFDYFDQEYTALYCDQSSQECRNSARFILKRNVLWGDALSMKTVCGNADPIVFSEWSAVNGSMVKRRDYTLANLLSYPSMDGVGLMEFDVIIGNPPYQLTDSGFGTSAMAIYDKFVVQAKKLNPRYLSMIIPARWFSGGKGVDEFRDQMLQDNRLRQIHDYPEASDCFPGVQIKGGVCYFLWDRENPGLCKVSTYKQGALLSAVERPLLEENCETFIRYNEAISILKKVQSFNEPSIRNQISARKPFGLPTTFKGKAKPFDKAIKIYQNGGVGYVSHDQIQSNHQLIGPDKVLISPLGSGSDSFPHMILGKPFVAEPNTACTETYLVAGIFSNEKQAQNLVSYISTRFFRFLVLLSKPTQHATAKVYTFVPVQDFSQSWDDERLYKKYGLAKSEIDFIESMIRPME